MSEGEARIRERNGGTIEFDAVEKCNFAIHSPITMNKGGDRFLLLFSMQFCFLFLFLFFNVE